MKFILYHFGLGVFIGKNPNNRWSYTSSLKFATKFNSIYYAKEFMKIMFNEKTFKNIMIYSINESYIL